MNSKKKIIILLAHPKFPFSYLQSLKLAEIPFHLTLNCQGVNPTKLWFLRFLRFSFLSSAILKYRQYFLMLQTLKLKNKKQKKIFVLQRKKFGRIDTRLPVLRKANWWLRCCKSCMASAHSVLLVPESQTGLKQIFCTIRQKCFF